MSRYEELQRRPFGSNTALSGSVGSLGSNNVGGAAGSQFRRQEAAYGQALRTLNRAARRGDTKSALMAIDVRNEAMGAGFAPGGIRDANSANAGIRGQVAGMERDTMDRDRRSRILQTQTDEDIRAGMRTPVGAAGAAGATGASPMMTEDERRRAEADKLVAGLVNPETGEIDTRASSDGVLNTAKGLGGNAGSLYGAIMRKSDEIKKRNTKKQTTSEVRDVRNQPIEMGAISTRI